MEIAVEVVIPDDLSPTSLDSGRVRNREAGESGSPSRVLVELEVRINPILQGEEVRGRYHFDDRARKVILPAALAPS